MSLPIKMESVIIPVNSKSLRLEKGVQIDPNDFIQA